MMQRFSLVSRYFRVVGITPALRVFVLCAAVCALGGCVTTTTGGFTEKASPQEALKQRVDLALQYIREGSLEDAQRNLRMAQDIDESSSQVWEGYGLVYQATGEFELAEESFEKSIRLDRSCSRCRNNYAAFLYSKERYAEAVKQLEFVVKDTRYPARVRAFINLGLAQQKVGNTAAAEEAFERVVAMERTNAIALLELAKYRLQAGAVEEANNYYQTYRRIVRNQPPAALLLGIRIARASGDRDAEASYVLALSNLYPDSDEYREYQRELVD